MARTTTGIRLSDSEREALKKAAIARTLAPTTLMRSVLVDWLRAQGWLKDAEG